MDLNTNLPPTTSSTTYLNPEFNKRLLLRHTSHQHTNKIRVLNSIYGIYNLTLKQNLYIMEAKEQTRQ